VTPETGHREPAEIARLLGSSAVFPGLAKLAADQAALVRALSTSQQLVGTSALASIGRNLDVARTLGIQSEAIKGLSALNSDLIKVTKGFQAQQAVLAKSLKAYRRLTVPSVYGDIARVVEMQRAVLAKTARASLPVTRLSSAALMATSSQSMLRAVSANLSVLSQLPKGVAPPATTAAIMRPLASYGVFSSRTVERISRLAPGSPIARPLVRSLDAAQKELGESTATAQEMLKLVTELPSGDQPPRIRQLNLLLVVRDDLLSAARTGLSQADDEGVLINLAEVAAEKGRKIQRLIYACNETAALAMNQGIFKVSDQVASVLGDLPWLVPRTKLQTGEFVTGLYFALYEAAGGKHLRFLGGSLLTDADCTFIWHLKHLRNKWLQHDVEHGSPRDIRRSRTQLKEAFEYFGAAHPPVTPAEFRRLHGVMLDEALRFLQELLSKLRDSDRST
jgi:hypothetical protein